MYQYIPMDRHSYRIPPELAAKLEAEAKATKRSRSEIVRVALHQYFSSLAHTYQKVG